MNSIPFHRCMRDKFGITDATTIISAIQKNLTGQEISPHPDIRGKALTQLLNINRDRSIELEDCHTHLYEFKDEYKHIPKQWVEHPEEERCWVPYDWCNLGKVVNKNNSIIIFQPSDDPPTLHAINIDYDHLRFQRTQIYGNLMYASPRPVIPQNYRKFTAGGVLL